ncbi:MAG: hypothetical protein HYV26_20630 [Candidatus Hydrogenedentes bacterium]|nr:hypothetical protein [Candidatus Hydrogenedentota bacterium]MBI3118519.1 hypothetical protein [Candidatus Hydrogenedentota bacterium]
MFELSSVLIIALSIFGQGQSINSRPLAPITAQGQQGQASETVPQPQFTPPSTAPAAPAPRPENGVRRPSEQTEKTGKRVAAFWMIVPGL